MMTFPAAVAATLALLPQVEVLSARHLPKKGGAFSTVDPQVKLHCSRVLNRHS
jgi:hypothetical protein